MKKLALLMATLVVGMVLAATTTDRSTAGVRIYVGPLNGQLGLDVGPRRCHWETRRGPCYTDTVCVRRNKWGRCKRFKRQKVCERQQVRVCY